MSTENRKTCFVIMPFTVRPEHLPAYSNDSSHWSQVFEGLIQPAAAKAELLCERDDQDLKSRLITDNIWRKIECADVILCDLSGTNPNVYLELGWALRADKRFVLIKDDVTTYSFDLSQHFTYGYDHRLQPIPLKASIEALSKVLVQTIQDQEKLYSITNKMGLNAKDQSLKTAFEQSPFVEHLLEKGLGLPVIRKQIETSSTVKEVAFRLAPFSQYHFLTDHLLSLFRKNPQAIRDLNQARHLLGLGELANDVDVGSVPEQHGVAT